MKLFISACFLLMLGNLHAQDVFDLSASDNVDILKDTLDDIPDGSTLLLGPGKTYNLGGDSIVIGKSLIFDSSDPAAAVKPHLFCNKNYDIIEGSEIAYLKFRNLRITGEFSSTYIFNITESGSIAEFTVENCDVYNIRGIIRIKGGEGVLDKYNMINCTVDSVRNYGVLAIDKSSWMCNDIVVKNSTFKNLEYFLISRNNSNSVLVENCTFDAMPEGGRPWFRWREDGQDNVLNGITIRNVIYSHAWDTNDGGIITDGFDGLGDTEWTIENSYATSEYTNEGEDTIVGFPNFMYAGTADDLWNDRANFDYSFKDESFAGIGNAGDPRWAPATPSDVIDLTSMANDTILLDTLPYLPDGGTILLGPGETYTLDNSYELEKSVEIRSSDPDADEKPILLCYKNFKLADATNIDFLNFKDLHIEGEDDLKDYILNIDSDNTVGEILIENCDVSYLRGILRAKGGTGTLDKFTIINCTVENIGGYGLITMDKDEQWVCNDILVKNSTIKKAEDFLVSESNANSVIIENCTLDQLPEAGEPLFKWKGADDQSDVLNGITIRNVIYSHAWDIDGNGYITVDGFNGLGTTSWTIENCYTTNEYTNDTLDVIPDFPSFVFEGSADDLWTDRANFDYTFKDLLFQGNNNAGDPRWWDDSVNNEELAADAGFTLYPNPTNGQIFIEVSQATTLAIFNLAGQIMIQERIETNRERMNISDLPKGLYIVRSLEGIGTAKKLIIE